jgi:hypothetical protein
MIEEAVRSLLSGCLKDSDVEIQSIDESTYEESADTSV